MKKILVILFVVPIIISCDQKRISNGTFQPDSIKIQYVSLSIMTMFRVDCEKYEELFNERIQHIITHDSNKMKELLFLLNNLQPITLDYPDHTDTRIKFYFYYENDSITSTCLNNICVEYNGRTYITSDSLLNFLSNNFGIN